MYKLVLMRHGESQWNLENRFTGWADVDLTAKGQQQAWSAGQLIKEFDFPVDVVYVSMLRRALKTMYIALDAMDRLYTPTQIRWRLNERHYGDLQGLNKAETAAKVGEEQVKIWRRSYSIAPPPLALDDPRHPRFDARYAHLDPSELPATECLKDTVARVLPLWHDEIAPAIQQGQNVLIVAHGNSLRALIKYLNHLSEEEILGLNIPTGQPLVFELDEQLQPIRQYYLGDPDEIAKSMAQVAAQGKAK